MVNTNKMFYFVASLFFGVLAFGGINSSVYASENPTINNINVKSYNFSNTDFFAIAEKEGVDVKGILGEEEYQKALFQDMLRAGGTYVNKYTAGGETRYTVAVNSALVKVWKYGGSGALTAIQLYGASVGLPFDAPIYYSMKASLSNADASQGFKWTIGTNPWRVISSGVQ